VEIFIPLQSYVLPPIVIVFISLLSLLSLFPLFLELPEVVTGLELVLEKEVWDGLDEGLTTGLTEGDLEGEREEELLVAVVLVVTIRALEYTLVLEVEAGELLALVLGERLA